jgi:hypothetical protein
VRYVRYIYIYDISRLRVKEAGSFLECRIWSVFLLADKSLGIITGGICTFILDTSSL